MKLFSFIIILNGILYNCLIAPDLQVIVTLRQLTFLDHPEDGGSNLLWNMGN